MSNRTSTVSRVTGLFKAFSGDGGASRGEGLKDIDTYNEMHKPESAEGRNANYTDLVNSYYNLATDFYEVGWGQSFHFANRLAGENFAASIARHEYWLALKLGLKPTDKVLDCGCGIGGPLRNVGRFSGADITGVTLNQYQVDRGNKLCREAELDSTCRLVQADFHKLPFPDAHFDHCYSIEACCHSPDRRDVYREIMRVLKPGGYFISYEWCLTSKYDSANPIHVVAKKKIEEGDGLPDMVSTEECDAALKDVGFTFIEGVDTALSANPGGDPWYTILTPSYTNPFRFQFTPLGTFVINLFLNFLEYIGLAPKGSGKVREMLRQAQLGLVTGGETGTFTPMYAVYAQKP